MINDNSHLMIALYNVEKEYNKLTLDDINLCFG